VGDLPIYKYLSVNVCLPIYLWFVPTHLQLVLRQDEFGETLTVADALWKMHEPVLVDLEDGETS
jgi:hypothetical protein